MVNFFKKILKQNEGEDSLVHFLEDFLDEILDLSQLELSFEMEKKDNIIHIEFFGEDEALLTQREGQTLEALQLLLKRAAQKKHPEEQFYVKLDANGFFKKREEKLIQLIEKLKSSALSRSRPVYFRPLPPRDRRTIHQYLSGDEFIKNTFRGGRFV